MSQERKGAVTFKGNPLTVVGPELKAGDPAPEFELLAEDLSTVKLSDSKGKTRLISVVPSLDTPVCDAQTRRFNEEAAKLPKEVVAYTVSADLPFAQKRFCSTAGINKIKVLSDHRDVNFGTNWGVLIKELRLDARAIFIVGPDNRIQYVEVVKEVTQHPNYDAALDVLKQKAGK